ncbi:hypothetical protein CLOBOL_03094 [Enterocloster bolteae ATCC BAA-613]|uniref:Uncharacterized protein n=1 Tax=Enterocloster bolteae (strain ATCC BAA-613 / DSM 15670 / CCUG 46953 / JCM 12243 / WAL 16351) TaxID=411902 RepID=A8RRU1_ENTBW|nr:hypothetical protein CLOBOL_03094 [Enterocloster bolteae ATCC BAA-613]
MYTPETVSNNSIWYCFRGYLSLIFKYKYIIIILESKEDRGTMR